MFVEFESPDAMKKALDVVHGYQIDKSHKFVAFPFSDIDKLKTMDKAELQVVPAEPFKEREHLCEWLGDVSARDQFFAFHGDTVTIYWNEKSLAAEEAFSQKVQFFFSLSMLMPISALSTRTTCITRLCGSCRIWPSI